ncbi:MAG: hypothetical protein LBP20_10225 [Treponema sp.]|jgi:hypothetical protein|nr:hypothetical protein [Treponema sp.]
MEKIFNRRNLLTCALLLPLIALAETLLFLLKLPAWPVMVCMVSFFLAEQEREKLPHIVVGGALGELSVLILNFVFIPLIWLPVFGDPARFAGVVVFVLIFVGLIVLLLGVLPKFFNSFTFLFFLAATLGAKSDTVPEVLAKVPLPLVWIAETLAGGALIILGCISIGAIVKKAVTAA